MLDNYIRVFRGVGMGRKGERKKKMRWFVNTSVTNLREDLEIPVLVLSKDARERSLVGVPKICFFPAVSPNEVGRSSIPHQLVKPSSNISPAINLCHLRTSAQSSSINPAINPAIFWCHHCRRLIIWVHRACNIPSVIWFLFCHLACNIHSVSAVSLLVGQETALYKSYHHHHHHLLLLHQQVSITRLSSSSG